MTGYLTIPSEDAGLYAAVVELRDALREWVKLGHATDIERGLLRNAELAVWDYEGGSPWHCIARVRYPMRDGPRPVVAELWRRH